MAQRRLGMRPIARVFGPHAPDTQTSRTYIFHIPPNYVVEPRRPS